MGEDLRERFQTLHEIVRAAHQTLDPGAWDYLAGGTETETTLRRNRQALDSIAFRPRVLRDVSKVDTTATLLGRTLRLPIMLAPVGSIETFTPGGAATAARGATAFGVAQILSSVCNPGLEATSAAAPGGLRIFQLYVRGDDGFVDDHVKRARDNGYAAFCLTVDSAMYSRRERDLAKRYIKPWRARATGMDFQAALSWDQVKRFKDAHDVPLWLKGIATGEDAEIACEHGVEGVYVSNHGGRQLDHGRGGTDVVKAIALGADCVGMGRIACCGLGAAGAEGLVRVLELLEDEIRICLGLLGVRRFAELDTSYLHRAEPVTASRVFSAFPLMDEGY